MTKKTLQLLASVALVAGLGMTTVTANASKESGQGTQDTTAKVTLNSDNGAGDNGNDGNGDGDGTNVAGNLAIVSAPDVTFENGTINGQEALSLKGTFSTSENSWKDKGLGAVAVVDPGTASGWKVLASNTVMKNDDTSITTGAAAAIQGGTIHYTGATLSSLDSGDANPATVDNETVSLPTAGTDNVPVYSANTGNGVGTWLDTFSGASLTVPAGNAAGSYTSTVTWTLSNTPGTTASTTDAK
ncbi:MAG: WxL domain-containing protein [Levilactobacillus sp.]|jgi:hypothetical protein|uniref:WxL domain-containing protein n=1 Tax=Levilactobacillus sp. TaxID=2767919 RepID=UPI00258DBB39|nr:WxL domain-containing protein [Levilactobacillus sp.]MCH4124222.1 WxL domain-containing protein [Levilactobacillus sp.]MCI1554493.1 WxL domain-containing protein [Levilactobacillus sp.]MCI1598334.1 WxL domain-containing protein [Levilactobacillus sp.]MCI1606416.1 WxL domain-containing protein [Levilactobacillus sp.]